MIQSLTPVSGNAIGALTLIGGAAENASADNARSTAAQEFAALLGTAMQQSKGAPKVALTTLVDATLDAESVATTDEDQATGIEIMEPETLFGATPMYVPIESTTVNASNTPATDGASDDETNAAESATSGRTHAARSARRAVRSLVPEVSDRTTDALDGDFSARLTRVLDAMRDAGYDVEIVETTRTQERQDALFAQGRTTDGPVVTWTRDSRHLTGDAADLRIDGKRTGPGYALLHQLAKDEGLRTLGARDPGHIELPRTTVDATDGAAARRGGRGHAFGATSQGTDALGTIARSARLAATARIARVAQVAQVARPAKVATVASTLLDRNEIISRIGQGARVSPVAMHNVTHGGQVTAQVQARATAAAQALAARVGTVTPRSEARVSTTVVGPQQDETAIDQAATTRTVDAGRTTERDANANGGAHADARSAANEQGARGAEARAVRASRLRRQVEGAVGALDSSRESAMNEMRGERGDSMGIGSLMRSAASRHAGATPSVSAAGQMAAARVADLLAARDAAPAPTIGELRMSFDQSLDGLSEVRLAVDGAALDATLRTSDIGVARGMQGEVASLARALEKHGFDSARVSVLLESAQQSRATALDTVAGSEATAGDRALRGDGSAAREGRDQQATSDTHREQQHARRFGGRRSH